MFVKSGAKIFKENFMLTFILCRCTLSSIRQDVFVTSVLSNMQFCNEHYVMFVLLAWGGGGGWGETGSQIVI